MEAYDIYRDIAERTDGDIYIGVVGPVRTGKSTFIKRFMDLLVLPRLEESSEKERVVDELPQSATGKTVMTTQPKFVPNEAVKIRIGDKAQMNVRMVDCVGYMVKGALGHLENNVPRMVRTPWFDHDIPFEGSRGDGHPQGHQRACHHWHRHDHGRQHHRDSALKLYRGGGARDPRTESAGKTVRGHIEHYQSQFGRCEPA